MELELLSLSTGTPPSDGLLSAPISLPLVELRVVVSFHSTPSLRSSPFVPLLGNSNSKRKGLEQENLASSISLFGRDFFSAVWLVSFTEGLLAS